MTELKLNTDIFDISCVEKTATAYKALCKIKINKTDNYMICRFTDCLYDEEETVREFENYIIDLMNTAVTAYGSY